jgi:hypothetical protein
MSHDASAPWRAARIAFLKARPLCCVQACGNAARHVDHITPRATGGHPFDLLNLQGMCHSCHSRKTARADGGFGRAMKPDVLALGCNADGSPIDPRHPWNAGGSGVVGMAAATAAAQLQAVAGAAIVHHVVVGLSIARRLASMAVAASRAWSGARNELGLRLFNLDMCRGTTF